MNLQINETIYNEYEYEYKYEYKYIMYENLMNDYIELIHNLIDSSCKMKILPLKIMFSIGLIKNYINENKLIMLENGIEYILANKTTILNFDTTKLDELDIDTDDNVSIKSCINNYKKSNQINSIDDEQDAILNLIIDIKNNSKKLSQMEMDIIKSYIELIIIVLEQIQNLFN
jgi:hypothetical protein